MTTEELMIYYHQIELEKRHKAVIASMNSRAKRVANMTPEEFILWKKKNCEASKRSHAKKMAMKIVTAPTVQHDKNIVMTKMNTFTNQFNNIAITIM